MSANDEFDQIINNLNVGTPVETIDPTPYGGGTVHHKGGLTKRGKAALGIGAAVIAGGGLIGYQVHSSNVAASEAKAQEIALKADALELQKLREMNRASEADRKTAASQEKVRQASVDSCVKSSADQVGKGYGSPSHRDIVDDCQAQYPSSLNSTDLGTAASTQAAGEGGDSSDGGVNQGLLIGGAALAVFFVAAVKKGTRSNQA